MLYSNTLRVKASSDQDYYDEEDFWNNEDDWDDEEDAWN